jgi:hypothetical protein
MNFALDLKPLKNAAHTQSRSVNAPYFMLPNSDDVPSSLSQFPRNTLAYRQTLQAIFEASSAEFGGHSRHYDKDSLWRYADSRWHRRKDRLPESGRSDRALSGRQLLCAKELDRFEMKYWEIIANKLSKAGWSWGCCSVRNIAGRTLHVVDAHRSDGRRFIAQSDEKLSAFLELEKLARPSPHKDWQARAYLTGETFRSSSQ